MKVSDDKRKPGYFFKMLFEVVRSVHDCRSGRKKGWAVKRASWLLRDVWCAEYWAAESARGQELLKNGGSKQNFVAQVKLLLRMNGTTF